MGEEQFLNWVREFRERALLRGVRNIEIAWDQSHVSGITFDTYYDCSGYLRFNRCINIAKLESRKLGSRKCKETRKSGMDCTTNVDIDLENKLVFLNFQLSKREELPPPQNIAKIFDDLDIDRI